MKLVQVPRGAAVKAATALALAGCLPAGLFAQSQDDCLREVHSVLRVTGAHVAWRANAAGGLTPTLVYDVANLTDRAVAIPVTTIGDTAAHWAGSRQHWIQRLGRDATIPAIPRGTARRGRQYAFGGYAIAWPAQVIAPRGFVRFEHPLGIGGFPSGRYALSVEYATTHRLDVLQSQVLFFDVP